MNGKSTAARLKILHVEDSVVDVGMIEHELRRGEVDFVIRRVDNETDFIKALDEFLPEVILSDYSMPGFSGARALKIRNQKAPDIPFIYASGTIGEEAAIEALHNGATDYVLKDNLKRLPNAVHRALREFEERRARSLAEAEIARQRTFLRQIIDVTPNLMFAKDREGRYALANRATAKAFGRPVAELLGKTDVDLGRDEEAVERSHQMDLEIMDTLNEQFFPEEAGRDAAGNVRWFQTTKRPILSEDGSALLVLGVSTDITARKEAEQRVGYLNRVYAVLSGINALIVRVHDRAELFREACRIAVEAGQFMSAYIAMANPDSKQLEILASCNIDSPDWGKIQTVLNVETPEGRHFRDLIMDQREPMVLSDIHAELPSHLTQMLPLQGIRAVCVLPLVSGEETVGILVFRASEPGIFDAEEMRLLQGLAGDIAFALDHLDKSERLDYLAYYDPLTGLANATLLHERLALYLNTASTKKQCVALALIDLERFKAVNDALGRKAGDTLLVQLAKRLADSARGPDEVAHLGNDHFAIVLPDVTDERQVARIVEDQMHRCFDKPFQIENVELNTVAKFGIALYPDDGADPETLFRNAETALKKAKTGGDRYLFYTQQMNERVTERLSLENKLRRALEREEFVLHYQPKVDSETGYIVGVEALIRWNDPSSGLVPPDRFIPLLEETGLILGVGVWALRRAASDYRHWWDSGLVAPRIAVNVSAIQLRQKNFVDVVWQSLSFGHSPPGIDLEITESLIMEDIEGNIGKLKAIRDMGINIAIDDFGTGYSSLAYLAKLPVGEIKIDRSFIITMLQDPNIMTLVSTIIGLAHSLGLKVVAEGVDQEAQAEALRRLRCDEMQGYLFSQPIPLQEMSALIGIGFK